MSSLKEQIDQISSDLSNGTNDLLALVKSFISKNDQISLIEVFSTLSNRISGEVPVIITNPSIEATFEYINTLSASAEKAKLLFPILNYIIPFESLRTTYKKEKDEFIEMCNQFKCYYELSNYYLRYEEKSNETIDDEIERLLNAITISAACLKAGNQKQALKYKNLAKDKLFHEKACPVPAKKKFYEFMTMYHFENNEYVIVSDYFFKLYSLDKENPENAQYLKRSAAYAILSNEPTKYAQITKLLNEEKMKKLQIYELLDRINKETIIFADELPKFKEQLSDVAGYSDENLNETILNQNIIAIARFYTTISFVRLSQITGVSIDVVLSHIHDLINKKAVNSIIDQPTQMIYFSSSLNEMDRKDRGINLFCKSLQQFISHI